MSEAEKLREAVVRMASEVRGMMRPEAEKTAYQELWREALAAFVFGMTGAFGKAAERKPSDLCGLMTACLHEVFSYFPEEAAQFVRELETAALDADGGGTAGAVIRQGGEGYALWKNRDLETLRMNLGRLMDSLEARERVEGKPSPGS